MIDLLPDTEEQQILDSIVGFFSAEAPLARLHREHAQPGPRDDEFWPGMAALGWFGMGLSEDKGGIGCSVVEEMLLFREAGRCLFTPTLLSTVLAVHAAASANNPDLVEQILSGSKRVTIASPLGTARLGASCTGDFHLFDARPDDLLLAWDRSGIAMFEAGSFGSPESIAALDETVTLQRAALHNAKPLIWIAGESNALCTRALVLNAAMLVGVSEGARDLSVAYAKVREQFGKAIGSFQAIKHACADMAMRSDAASAQTTFTALALRAQRTDALYQAVASKIIAVDAAIENSTRSITIHGGMGFTADCDANLFLKRAHVLNQIGGNQRQQQSCLLDLRSA